MTFSIKDYNGGKTDVLVQLAWDVYVMDERGMITKDAYRELALFILRQCPSSEAFEKVRGILNWAEGVDL